MRGRTFERDSSPDVASLIRATLLLGGTNYSDAAPNPRPVLLLRFPPQKRQRIHNHCALFPGVPARLQQTLNWDQALPALRMPSGGWRQPASGGEASCLVRRALLVEGRHASTFSFMARHWLLAAGALASCFRCCAQSLQVLYTSRQYRVRWRRCVRPSANRAGRLKALVCGAFPGAGNKLEPPIVSRLWV
jgi:hypothetical protein